MPKDRDRDRQTGSHTTTEATTVDSVHADVREREGERDEDERLGQPPSEGTGRAPADDRFITAEVEERSRTPEASRRRG